MKFTIEQIAITPRDPERAISFLRKIGAEEWARDHVIARGEVFGKEGRNSAFLSFNYDLGAAKEFEVLHYADGPNWMEGREPAVSHLGMHVTEEELAKWREFMESESIGVAQEVLTESHSNPVIAGKRWYNYVIFDTRSILGVDLKFILRKDHGPLSES